MDKTEKRRWTKADILLISVGLLLLLALIGQEIVAFQIERKNKAERFMVGFCLLSVEQTAAQELQKSCSDAEKGGLTVLCGTVSLGEVYGGVVLTEAASSGGEISSHLMNVSGSLQAWGRTENGKYYLYEYGKLEVGDRNLVSVDGLPYDMEVESIEKLS